MIKRLIIAVVLLGVVVGGIVGFNLFRDRIIADVFANMQPPPVGVSVIEAEPITWRPGIEAIGTASAARGVDLSVEAGGVVEEILFTANDRVEAGQRLLQIRDQIERADLAAAQASLQLSQTELRRVLQLQERGVGSGASVEIRRGGCDQRPVPGAAPDRDPRAEGARGSLLRRGRDSQGRGRAIRRAGHGLRDPAGSGHHAGRLLGSRTTGPRHRGRSAGHRHLRGRGRVLQRPHHRHRAKDRPQQPPRHHPRRRRQP